MSRLLYQTVQASLIAILVLFLSGCLHKPAQYLPSSIPLSAINHWDVKARVAINTPEENVSATLDWQKRSNNFDFHIYGLFGATYAHLIQQNNQATLNIPDHPEFQGNSSKQLLQQTLGWDFPIDALSYWVKGLPSGKSGEIIERDNEQNLSQIQFSDWQVYFSRYQSYQGYQMPKIIRAVHPQLSLKIVIKSWTFLPPTERL